MNRAERASEGAPVQLERVQHLAALAHPHAVLVAHVGVPDSALGIDADPVGVIAGSRYTRRLLRPPSAPMSYAVSRLAYDSATIRDPPSGVIAIPLGNATSPAT